jgi:hypothetical protein
MSGFFLPDDEPAAAADNRSRDSQSQKADVARAVAAAQQAGLQDNRIEIALDGTISIVVGKPSAG